MWLRSHVKNSCFVFHQGCQTPRNNKGTRPAASYTKQIVYWNTELFNRPTATLLWRIFLPLPSRWFLNLLHTAAALALFPVSSPSRKILFRCVFTFPVKRIAHLDVFRAHPWGILKTGWSKATSELGPVSLPTYSKFGMVCWTYCHVGSILTEMTSASKN